MKAIQLDKPKKFQVIDIDEPGPPGPGEALVRTHSMGICGTDISGFLGKMPFFKYPRIPGHELGVEVLEVGDGVDNVASGDCCSVETYMNCCDCNSCRKGASNCCAKMNDIGVMIEGGLRSRFTLPARKLHRSEELSFEQLALVETLAIGCHATDRSAAIEGEDCLIIGAGPIGLSVIEFVKLTGARTIVLDMNQHRLNFCADVMNVDETILLSDNLEEDLLDVTNGNLPDVVFDATGSNKSMSNAFTLIAPTGRLVFVGITTDEVTFRHPIFHKPEGTLVCRRNALPRDFTRIIKLIEDGKINTTPWITHHLEFDDVVGEFEKYTRPETGAIKAIIDVS